MNTFFFLQFYVITWVQVDKTLIISFHWICNTEVSMLGMLSLKYNLTFKLMLEYWYSVIGVNAHIISACILYACSMVFLGPRSAPSRAQSCLHSFLQVSADGWVWHVQNKCFFILYQTSKGYQKSFFFFIQSWFIQVHGNYPMLCKS